MLAYIFDGHGLFELTYMHHVINNNILHGTQGW